jgi:integrase
VRQFCDVAVAFAWAEYEHALQASPWATTRRNPFGVRLVRKLDRRKRTNVFGVGLLTDNPARHVANPEPKRREVQTFSSVAELEAVGAELSPAFRAIPVFCGLTGLRCEESIGLMREDVDRENGIVRVRRVVTSGTVKPYGKQAGSLSGRPAARQGGAGARRAASPTR